MKNFFLEEVRKKGGFSCYHAHFDKAYLMNPEIFKRCQASLQKKWSLYRDFKTNYTQNDLLNRMSKCVVNMIKQDVKYVRTFVDADSIVKQKCIDAAIHLKELYEDQIKIDIAIQPLEGLEDSKSKENFLEAMKRHGFEIEKTGITFKGVPEARDVETINAGVTNLDLGNFVRVTNAYNIPDIGDISGETTRYKTLNLMQDFSWCCEHLYLYHLYLFQNGRQKYIAVFL